MDVIQPLMELLKLLGTLGSYTLAVAITAIIGFLIFKLSQLVSILLIIKYFITKVHDWAITKKVVYNTVDKTVIYKLDDKTVFRSNPIEQERFRKLLNRLINVNYRGIELKDSDGIKDYMHPYHLDYLEKALDYYRDRDQHKQGVPNAN